MRLLYRAIGPLELGFDVDQAQLVGRYAGHAQGYVFDDGEVLAVAPPLSDGFERRGPIVALLPDGKVVFESDVAVDEVVDLRELGLFAQGFGRIHCLQPVFEQRHAGRAEAGNQLALQGGRIKRG